MQVVCCILVNQMAMYICTVNERCIRFMWGMAADSIPKRVEIRLEVAVLEE